MRGLTTLALAGAALFLLSRKTSASTTAPAMTARDTTYDTTAGTADTPAQFYANSLMQNVTSQAQADAVASVISQHDAGGRIALTGAQAMALGSNAGYRLSPIAQYNYWAAQYARKPSPLYLRKLQQAMVRLQGGVPQ